LPQHFYLFRLLNGVAALFIKRGERQFRGVMQYKK
jgi:hypothetical protein